MESLELFPVDILTHITSFLSQKDIVTLSETSKRLSRVHPRNIVKRFSPDATEDAYVDFLRYVSRRPIETLKVYVDPYVWNPLAKEYLGQQVFKRVTVIPNHPEMYKYTRDETSWIPRCDEYVSGFASETDNIYMTCSYGKLYMLTNHTSLPDVPYVDQETGIHSIVCSGRFANYDRIWTIPNIYMKMTVVTPEMLARLARCWSVGIDTCEFIECYPVVFDAEIISVGLDAFPFIYDAPNCTQLVITSHGPLGDIQKYIRRDFQKGAYPRVEKVILDGYLNEADFDQFSTLIRAVFPSHVVFQFHIRLVNS